MMRHHDDDDSPYTMPGLSQGSVSSQQTSRSARSFIAGATGTAINSVIGLVDVDGVFRRVDVNDLVNRVEWNDVIDEIDWNNLLEHIDMDALMHRIDVNSVVERIDVNALIERSNLKSIIARSTSGICLMALDSFRAICIKTDQLLQRMGHCADCCFCCPDYAKWTLPPLPTVTPIKRRKDRHKDRKLRRSMACPRKSTHLAIAVQGRCAGTCSRFLAFCIDKGLTIGFAFLLILIIARLIDLAETARLDGGTDPPSNKTVDTFNIGDGTATREERIFMTVVLPILLVGILGFMFDAAALTIIGRTLGKMIMGLMVVDSRHGRVKHLSVYQACLRAALTNTGVLVVLGVPLSLFRDDRRGFTDLICGTTVIYAWDAKRYRLAEEDISRDMPFGDLESHTNSTGRRRSSIFGNRKKRQAITGGKRSATNRVETRVVTVPVMDDDDFEL